MLDEQGQPDAVRAGNGAGRLARSAAGVRRSISSLHGEESVAVVNFNDEHLSSIIALQSQELGNEDRQSERESNHRKETGRLTFILVIVAIMSVVGIIAFLTIYKEPGLLGYILSGIGGLIAGAFGGYGYANRPR